MMVRPSSASTAIRASPDPASSCADDPAANSSMTMTLEIELTPTDGGTRFTQTLGMKPPWYLVPVNAILWPLLLRKRAQAGMDKTGANTKRLAEGSAQTEP